MKTSIERLQKLRDIAILKKDKLQFGLTCLLIDLEYGTTYEREQMQTNEKELELMP